MIDEFFDNIDVNLFDNMATQLECTVAQCDLGDGGAKWKTAALSENNAMKYLERHVTNAHGQHDAMGRTNVGGGAGGNSRQVKVSMVDGLICIEKHFEATMTGASSELQTGVIPDCKVD